MSRRKTRTNDRKGREELLAIATVTIADAIEYDPLTGKTRVKPQEQWSERAKLGLHVETDRHGNIKSISTCDRLKAIKMLWDNNQI